jgi:hypothetical protein
MTTTDSWLPLTEYSIKHHVSISTLRRRIKSDDIKFRFDDGKYFILDDEQKKAAAEEHRPSPSSAVQKNSASSFASRLSTQRPAREASQDLEIPSLQSNNESGESVITAANRLLTDLKKAYTQVLQEKEEQIYTLREEIVDLKTLIKVLESENARLHSRHNN